MKLLALDTSSDACSVALIHDGQVLHRHEVIPRQQARRVLPVVSELLAAAELAVHDLDALAFGRGPGSFTGVRIAAGVTQGMAFGTGLGVVPVSDLAAIAQGTVRELGSFCVLVCLDARMGEVYWGAYAVDQSGLVATVAAEQISVPAGVKAPFEGDYAGAGSGFAAYPELARRLELSAACVHPDRLPDARDILSLAIPEVEAGRMVSAAEAVPVYLREKVASKRGGMG